MFSYEKMLQYPVNIKNPNPKYAQIVLEQYGGPDGELGASLRYLSQRFRCRIRSLKDFSPTSVPRSSVTSK